MSTEIKPGQVWAWHPDAGTGGGQFEIKAIDRDMASYGYLPDPNVLPYRAPQSLIREKATLVTDVDATPAPLDPSKVRAGDTVTLLVDPPDTHPAFTVAGETHSLGGPTVYLGGWRVDDLPDYVTLTDHQPAPEPEPEWLEGAVAEVTPTRRPDLATRAVRGSDDMWHNTYGGMWDDDEVSVRPLVVIDPAAARKALEDNGWGEHEMTEILHHLGIEATS